MKFLMIMFSFAINLNVWAIPVTRYSCVDAAQDWEVQVGISGVGNSSQGVLEASLKNWKVAYQNLDKSVSTDFGTVFGPTSRISFNMDQVNNDFFIKSDKGIVRLKCNSTTKEEQPSFCPTAFCTKHGKKQGQKEVIPGYICHPRNIQCKV